MAEFIRIKGWGKYQHYKDRNPPWIKLHRELLTSLTWAMADDASRVLAVACMLLAAATDNKIPFDSGYVKRVAYLNHDPDFSQLLKLEFLEVIDDKGNVVITAITPLADASKMQAHARPETETETEQSKKEQNLSSRSRSKDELFEKAYEQYPRHVGKRAALSAWEKAAARHATEFSSNTTYMIYQRVMVYAAFCNRSKKEKQFIPHMATWLNQDRFMDDPSEWAVTESTNGEGNSKGDRRAADISKTTRDVFGGSGILPGNDPTSLPLKAAAARAGAVAGNPQGLLVSGIQSSDDPPDKQPAKI